MEQQVFDERIDILLAHWDDDLFSGRPFSGHLDSGLWLYSSFDDIANLIDFVSIKIRKHFLDFEYFSHICWGFRDLSIWFSGLQDFLGFVTVWRLFVLEILQYDVNFFGRFGWKGRGWWNLVDWNWSQFGNRLVGFLSWSRRNSGSKFQCNLFPESFWFIVSIERVPTRLINRWDEVPDCVACVKITEGGLNFYLTLSFLFYFLFHFRSIFLFLELGIGLSDKDHIVTWQVTSDDMVTSHMIQGRT